MDTQFKKQTNLNAYFCDLYTLERFHHYLKVEIADTLKECATIFQQENLHEEVTDLKYELEEMHHNLDSKMSEVDYRLRD